MIPRQRRDRKLTATPEFCKRGNGFPACHSVVVCAAAGAESRKTLAGTGLGPKHDLGIARVFLRHDRRASGVSSALCLCVAQAHLPAVVPERDTARIPTQELVFMHTTRRSSKTSSLLFGALFASPLAAQSAVAPPAPPTIEVSGSGEAKVTPDRALVYVGVQTKGRTAALAGQENAKLATAVLDAVRASGIAREQIGTMNYSVNPSYRYYPDGRKPELTGYDASNTVRVEVRNLDLVGKVIDAALGAGANNISGINFFASQIDATKREALGAATTDARLSAEVMAKAAGGTLGALVTITSQMQDVPRPMPQVMGLARAKVADAETPMMAPTEQTVTATVVGRWQFIPGAPR